MLLVKKINKVRRFYEIPTKGVICDLLWSDPLENYEDKFKFLFNENRRCSFQFSSSAVKEFLEKNQFKILIRAHEVQLEGYKLYNWYNNQTQVITLFSAPNYCN